MRCCAEAGEGLRHLEEREAEFEERARQQGVFGFGEVAFGLLCEDAEHVDGLACAEDIDLRLLAGLGASAELQDGLHVDGLDERFEGEGGGMVRTGVGSADGEVEALGGGVEGAEGLLHLLGGGAGGLILFGAFAGRGCGLLRRGRFDGGGGHFDHFRGRRRLGCRGDFGFAGRLGRGFGALAGLSVGVELAAVGDDEGKWLIGHALLDSKVKERTRTKKQMDKRGKAKACMGGRWGLRCRPRT